MADNYQKFMLIYEELSSILNRKTKDIDRYNKQLIKTKTDVSFLKDYILEHQLTHRTYFQVSLGLMKTYQEQFQFIEDNASLLQDWWHVDQLTQFMIRPIDFNYALEKAKVYITSDQPFLRRWGYVLFLNNLHKDYSNCTQILSLFKDDDEYYVQMAEAWLISEMATHNFDLIYSFLKDSKIKYNILGKSIQKICDSFRITDEQKQIVKDLRLSLKNN